MGQFRSHRITDPSIRRLFEGKNFAFVSTVMSNGYPHTTPTWVDLEDGNILINTSIGMVKQKNVSRDPTHLSLKNYSVAASPQKILSNKGCNM
jgi:hypothetical protein